MDFQVILSDAFNRDLEAIVSYLTKNAGPVVAERVGNELINRAIGLGRAPGVGQIVKGRPGRRKILCHPYCIYYRPNHLLRTVDVLRVWHGARDPRSLRVP